MNHLLLIGLLLLLGGSAVHAQRCNCPPARGPLPDREAVFEERYFKWDGPTTRREVDSATVQHSIAVVDSVVREHFRQKLEGQLRGRADELGQGRKLVEASPHALFLCRLDSLHQRLEARLDRLDDRGVPSLKPVFQAYLNSLKIYRSQSRNLVEWENRFFGTPRKPRTWFVPVHEGNIDDFNQAYQFMELCKNNLLKEFSVLEVSRKAEQLEAQLGALTRQLSAVNERLNLVLKNQQTLLDRTAPDSTSGKGRLNANGFSTERGDLARRRKNRGKH